MIPLDTHLTAVTVYPDRARLVRSGRIALEAGMQRLEIAGLPLQMNSDSARATARGTARARLMGLQVQRVFFKETPDEQVGELEAQFEALQDEMQGLEAQIELAAQGRAKVDALAGHTERYARALAAGKMTVEAQLALFDSLRVRAGELDSERQKLLAGKRSLERRLKQVENQLGQLRNARPRERYAAQLEVDVSQAGDLTVEISYVVSGAGWQPLYDLRLVDEGQPMLEVGYLAQVTQRCGEDWSEVELSLSTARPALAATLPELDPWYVFPMPPPQPRPPLVAAAPMQEAMEPMGLVAKAGEMARGLAAMEEMEAEAAVAGVETSGAAVTYRVPGKASVPADGAPHKVSVARYNLPPKLDYVTAPRLAEAAYRRAKATNDSPYTLLPGAANLFAGEEFVGSTRLELVAPQGEIELYLGADDRVKVERELKRREVDKSLIGGKRRTHFGYEIRLENLLEGEARLTVHDQIPVSRHEEIKVRLESAEPKPAQQSELNLLDWEITLARKEKRTIRFDFTVEYPQGMEVVGLV